MQKPHGKLIVIDGGDGSGKATQLKILAEKLKTLDYQIEIVDFPQYGQKSAGMVEEYLTGRYGTADEVGPYGASIFYAIDRYDASFKIREWLKEGKIVLSNRYVASNMAHQGGKIKNDIERQIYFKWLHELEYDIFCIPRPSINLILHVNAEMGQKLVDKKGHRDYVGGEKRDIHEADINHLKNAVDVYTEIAQTFDDFEMIECMRNGNIMSLEEIHEKILEAALKVIKR
ncbi:MAG: thymidylate kinase [Patescibacteria group bacterium]|jgi:dTMP kinase